MKVSIAISIWVWGGEGMRNNHRHNHLIYGDLLSRVVDELCKPESYKAVYHRGNHDMPMPSVEELERIVELLRATIFPGYFRQLEVKPETMRYIIGTNIDQVIISLSEQLKRGNCFTCTRMDAELCTDCDNKAREITKKFIERLPHIRYMLSTDVMAAFEGDPAAKHTGEAIFCYPSIRALTCQRIAHELYKLEAELIPRIITEMAHSETGIDIHPGASIGERFFIDHGTGVVIGETARIGENVRLYQGVTLGARSFPLDANGNPIKGIDRHPKVEDNVIIYAGATILGNVTIGRGAEIGGNVWITNDVPRGAKISQSSPRESIFEDGGGI